MPRASRANGASGRRTRSSAWPQAVERQKELADRAQRSWSRSRPSSIAQIAELERANSESQVKVGEASAAEQEAETLAGGDRRRECQAANERSSEARERRAAAAARAEAQQARSAELAHACGREVRMPAAAPARASWPSTPRRRAIPTSESAALERLTAERERIGPVNLVAERELAELDESRTKGAEEAEELTQAIHRLRGSIGNLNREGRVRLLDAYEQVDGHFRRLFTTLFDGGQAHLELVESDDPLEAGLEIMAQPPGKRLSTLTLLSGGEQALTAIALIFALFLTNPAPICVLDEVDAPLDDANVERFCDLLDRMTERDRHPLSDRHPQCGDDEPDAPPLRRDDDREGRQPPGLGRSGRRGNPARRGIAKKSACASIATAVGQYFDRPLLRMSIISASRRA